MPNPEDSTSAVDPAGSADPFVLVTGVSRRFRSPGGEVDALVDVNATVERGTMTVLAGPSGSGKSTLLMLIAAADRPDAGDIDVGGVSLMRQTRRDRRRWRRDRLGIVMPQPSDNLTERHDVIGNLLWSSSLRVGRPPLGRVEALEALGRVDLDDAADLRIAELSGGQQMRLAVQCAVVGEPALVVIDEPTASLDAAAASTVVGLLRQLADDGITLVVATHDPAIIAAADNVVRLDHGRVVM